MRVYSIHVYRNYVFDLVYPTLIDNALQECIIGMIYLPKHQSHATSLEHLTITGQEGTK